jgi:putative serine protease PepD
MSYKNSSLTKHNIIAYSLIAVLLITQVSTIIYFKSQDYDILVGVDGNLSSVRDEIAQSFLQTQLKITDISNALLRTESSLKSEINVLKAQTSEDFSGIIENAVPSVVSIRTNVAQGTGFVVSRIDGESYIVTNAHVLEDGRYAQVIDYSKNAEFADLVGFDQDLDIALLRVSKSYTPLEFTDSVSVGERVIAIGNPLGLSFSVTEGIISSLDRPVSGYSSRYIQTDVALNPGNSGGPLIDRDGFVVGINNFKISDAENIGFALPSSYAVNTINRLANSTIVNLS